jgi:UDP-glucose 4-epimerase
MKRILVTGGAGFIGSHMAEALINQGYEVIVIDNESTGFLENIPKGAHYIKGDVSNKEDLNKAFDQDPDAVFHIAGQASTIKSFNDPCGDLNTNVIGTINIIESCLETKVPRLLYASSMTCYGHPEKIPTPIDSVCRPISYYGITKYAAERYVHATAMRNDLDFDFNVTSFRMFNVYGERQSLENPYQGVMAIFISNVLNNSPITIHSDGKQSRDFVYIRDVVDAWISAIDNSQAYGRVFNLGTGRGLSINQLVDLILKANEKDRSSYPVVYKPERPGDQRHMRADISKIKSILNWNPKTDMEQGIYNTIRWASDHWAKQNKTLIGRK